MNFQVTAVNKNSVDVNADVTRNFEVQDQNSFYFAVYNTDDDTVLMQQQISGADLNALRSDGGLKKSLGLATVLDDTSAGKSVTVALCYGSYPTDGTPLSKEQIQAAQKSYLMIPNPFKTN